MSERGYKCRKWKRVRGRLVCALYKQPRRPGMGFRPGHTPANYRARCQRYQLVFSPRLNKKVYRCASFGPGRAARRPGLLRRLLAPSRPRLPAPPRKRLPPPPEPRIEVDVPILSLPAYERISHVPSVPARLTGRRMLALPAPRPLTARDQTSFRF